MDFERISTIFPATNVAYECLGPLYFFLLLCLIKARCRSTTNWILWWRIQVILYKLALTFMLSKFLIIELKSTFTTWYQIPRVKIYTCILMVGVRAFSESPAAILALYHTFFSILILSFFIVLLSYIFLDIDTCKLIKYFRLLRQGFSLIIREFVLLVNKLLLTSLKDKKIKKLLYGFLENQCHIPDHKCSTQASWAFLFLFMVSKSQKSFNYVQLSLQEVYPPIQTGINFHASLVSLKLA